MRYTKVLRERKILTIISNDLLLESIFELYIKNLEKGVMRMLMMGPGMWQIPDEEEEFDPT
ncbi:hypothetical protein [Kosmotoga pacifica]|uniref:hypothetical protein n=1 Tax=Kosmotoga pacifica TaxID=1330330 RepID=UPI000A4C0142|nr:hypothetical protein [Kosmotoga pacifica]